MAGLSSSRLTESGVGMEGFSNFLNDSLYVGFFNSSRRGTRTLILLNSASKLNVLETGSLFSDAFFLIGSRFCKGTELLTSEF